MNFLTAVKTCFKKYFYFKGRARRSEFWYWTLFTIVAGIVLTVLDSVVFNVTFESEDFGPLSDTFTFATIIPGIAVSWRRLHDINRSGWWVGGGYLAIIAFAAIATGAVLGGGLSDEGPVAILFGILIIIGLLVILGWLVILLVFFCTDTKAGDNRFGEDPKYSQGAAVFD